MLNFPNLHVPLSFPYLFFIHVTHVSNVSLNLVGLLLVLKNMSRQLELPSCNCKNICNRKGKRRGACPCFSAERFCNQTCQCGSRHLPCVNRLGDPASLLSTRMGATTVSENTWRDKNYGYGSDEEEQASEVRHLKYKK